METATFNKVKEVLHRVVKSDGRCGGLQRYAGQTVDIVTYQIEEDGN